MAKLSPVAAKPATEAPRGKASPGPARRSFGDLLRAPRRPVVQGHPEGVELSWNRLIGSEYELLVYERLTKQSYRIRQRTTRAVLKLPVGEYNLVVRLPGRKETAAPLRRFRITSAGAVEQVRTPVPLDSLRYKLYQRLSQPIAASKQRLRKSLARPRHGPRRFTRLVEITVFSWRAWKYLRRRDGDVLWVAHDLYALPVTFLLATLTGGALVYDAVELSFGRWTRAPGRISRRIILAAERLCRRADCVLVGSPYLLQDVSSRHRRVEPVLFLNAQESIGNEERSDYLRDSAGQSPDATIVLFLGGITRGRGLEEMIAAASHLSEGVHLVMMGSGADGAYSKSLQELAAELEVADRVSILGPVPRDKVAWAASSADIGISPASREFDNGRYNLNNKLFHYIAAGLPVVASDVEGIGGFVLSEGIGDVFDERDPRSIAHCINRLIADPDRLAEIRARLPVVAEKYSWESQRTILLEAFARVQAKPKKVRTRRRRATRNGGSITVWAPDEAAPQNGDVAEVTAVPRDADGAVATAPATELEERLEQQSAALERARAQLAELQTKHREQVVDLRERVLTRTATVKATKEKLVESRQREAKTREELRGAVADLRQREREVAWVKGDPTTETTGWPDVPVASPPYLSGQRSRIRVLLLNSMGGSMGRLSKTLMLHEGVDADVMVGAYAPRRNLLYPHEPNVYGVLSHDEWRNYLTWALNEYDVIQTTSLPWNPAIAECYDWLTERLGRRHVWRETGFVHHYLLREDVIPLETYYDELGSKQPPGPKRYTGKTFAFTDTHILTDPYVMLYSSPEKGAYFQGKDTIWLPSMRDPETFHPGSESSPETETVRVYVPHHGAARLKGLKGVLADLEQLRAGGAPIEVITSETAFEVFPDLPFRDARAEGGGASYPIPSHKMPELYRRVDLVVDQLVMGCYGNTGIEAMFSGKPVIGQKRFEDVADAPIWDADPGNFRDRFLDLLDRRDEWDAMGEAGREYALRRHSPEAVAKVAADLYRRLMEESRD